MVASDRSLGRPVRSTLLSPRGEKDTCVGHQYPEKRQSPGPPSARPDAQECPQVPAKCQSSPLAPANGGTWDKDILRGASAGQMPPTTPAGSTSSGLKSNAKGMPPPRSPLLPPPPVLQEHLSGGQEEGNPPGSTPHPPQGCVELYCFLTKAP